jgi:hypothetical protein
MMEERTCLKCSSHKTWDDKNGYQYWHKVGDSFLCNSCYAKQRRLEGHHNNNNKPCNIIQCKCGCGQTRLDRDNQGRLREYIKGHYNRDRKLSEKTKEKLRGDKNYGWKADEVGYGQIHDFVGIKRQKPEFCETCHKVLPYDLAFLLHPQRYTRNPDDYRWLCRSCHMILDYKNGTRKPTSIPRISLGQICSCGGTHIIRVGISLHGKQRFKCRNCKRGWYVTKNENQRFAKVIDYDLRVCNFIQSELREGEQTKLVKGKMKDVSGWIAHLERII